MEEEGLSGAQRATDEELYGRVCAEGSETAFAALFDRHYTSLSLFALRYLPDEDRASDIVQSVFVTLWEQRQSAPPANLRAYLYTAVRNAALNALKHDKVHRAYEAEQLATTTELSDTATDAAIEAAETQAAIAAALQQLPPKQREIFMLSRFECLSNQEIADQLALSKRTVETQITNALRTLRELLGDR